MSKSLAIGVWFLNIIWDLEFEILDLTVNYILAEYYDLKIFLQPEVNVA